MSRRNGGYILDHNGRPAGAAPAILGPNAQSIVPGAPPMPPLDQIVPALRAHGVVPALHIGWDEEGNIGVVAQCGPVAVPCQFDVATAEKSILPHLVNAIAQAKTKLAGPPPDGCEDLLAEANANVEAARAPFAPAEAASDPSPVVIATSTNSGPIELGAGPVVVELSPVEPAE